MATRNTRRGLSTNQTNNQLKAGDLRGIKRNQELSPKKPTKRTRTAFGDITNKENVVGNPKRVGVKKPAVKGGKKKTTIVVPKPEKEATKALSNSQQEHDQSWEVIELSQESHSSNSQHSNREEVDVATLNDLNIQLSQELQIQETEPKWENIDEENMMDPFQVALYADDIFQYYKEREAKFVIGDYLSEQHDLNSGMRAILVDWLVEVQENFELNHETLYLAVKLVDHYLCNHQTQKQLLQLVGAAAMFLASKFDERYPPILDDFLYVCDDAYSKDQFLEMERTVFRSVDFDLGMPLSYRFLRRFAKCGRIDMVTLTLARYILEMSLVDYVLSRESECKVAAAALLLAKSMKQDSTWNKTLEHYSGFVRDDLCELMYKLNKVIASPPNKHLKTIRTKYRHMVFHEVANIAPLQDLEETC